MIIHILSGLFAAILGYVWFKPINKIRRLADVGFKSMTKSEVKRIQKSRRLGMNLPPPYPNGWRVVAESREVSAGSIKRVAVAGQQLIVTRSLLDQSVSVTDAYCPHLGANLAQGGIVLGDCIQCPFHKWSFDLKTGKCNEIPDSRSKVPRHGQLKVWECLEQNQLVFVWYHVDGLKPSHEVPMLQSVHFNEWVYHGRTEYEVACHIQEIPENGADVAHLSAIHKDTFLVGGEPEEGLLTKLLSKVWHEWHINWSPETTYGQEHMATIKLTQEFVAFGLFRAKADIVAFQIGPSLVHLHFTIPILNWRGVMIQYIQTMEPMLQKIVHVFYTDRKWIRPLAKLTLLAESVLLERDIVVWNHKTFLDKPMYASKEDRFIKQYRKWYSQFYSGNSITFKDSTKTLEW